MYKATIGVVLGVSKTGQTLSAQLIDSSGATVGSEVATGFVEVGQGNYLWTYEEFPDNFRGGVKFLSEGQIMAFATINPEQLEYVDVKISTRSSGAATVPTFTIPTVSDQGTPVVFRQTDDYFASEGRSIDVTSAGWPELADNDVFITVSCRHGGFQKTLPVLANNVVRLELSKTELGTIGGGRWPFEIYAILANDHRLTLLTGDFQVTPPFSD